VRAPALAPSYECERIPVGGFGPRELLRNFVRAATGDEPLLSPASEGLRSIELSSALLASGLGSRTVELLGGDGERHSRRAAVARPS
jgi:hypothetical protein